MTNVEISTRLGWLEHRNRLLDVVTSIASHMAANHDIDVVLERITARTKELTRTDMAYISLNDAKETFIQYSTGVRTEEYRSIRMPLGAGVLGKAAVGGGMVQTGDYLVDPDITHLEEIDEIVRGEGVRAILGVPISVHGALHGALLVANRTPGPFSATTIDTVTTVAYHTAIALDQAQRFREVSAALAGLRESVDDSTERLQDLQNVVNLDALLSESLAQQRGINHFAQTAAKALGTSIAILDSGGTEIARGTMGIDPELPPMSNDLGRQSYESGRPVIRHNTTAVAATSHSEHLGTIIIFEAVPNIALSRVNRTAVFLGILLLFERTQRGEARQRDQALVDDLLQRRKLTPLGQKRFEPLVHNNSASVAAVHVEDKSVPYSSSNITSLIAKAAAEHSLTSSRYLAVEHHDHLCLILPRHAAEDFLRSLVTAAWAQGLGLFGAIGGDIASVRDFSASHALAMTAMSALRTLGGSRRIQRADQLGALGVILAAQSSDPHAYSPLSLIDPLQDYDREHGTELTRTAWVYCESRASVTTTARTLIVQANTVRQRLVRISDILGSDWQESQRLLDIHLGLRIWALKNETVAPSQYQEYSR